MKEAVKLGTFFETRKRDTGESFVTLKDDRPDWLYDAIHDAHSGDLPNDWIYAECEAACDAIDDGSIDLESCDVDDSIHEHADGCVDIYTRAVYQWAADMCGTSTYSNAESEAEDLGPFKGDTEKRLQVVQFCAIRQIVSTIVEAAREAREGDQEDDAAED